MSADIPDQKIHHYRGDDVDVTWSKTRCIHVAECVRGLPAVFDTSEKPWVQPDQASADAVVEVVTRCPTGALHARRKDGGEGEQVPSTNTVSASPDGPLYLRGNLRVVDRDGTTLLEDTRLALCRCGASRAKPFCDGSHEGAAFSDDVAIVEVKGRGADDDEGVLIITPMADGPVRVAGPMVLLSGGPEGNVAGRTSGTALCRCGASKAKPFCDGSHTGIAFKA